MKKLLTASFLIFFLGTTFYLKSEAKVLPIIEGSELLDTLASQSNDELNMPSLTTGTYNYVNFEYAIGSLNNFPDKKMIYRGKSFLSYSLMIESYNSLLYLKPEIKLRFTRKIIKQHLLENI